MWVASRVCFLFRWLSLTHRFPCAAPGRVMDFIETGKLPCDQVKFFVLDEAGGCP